MSESAGVPVTLIADGDVQVWAAEGSKALRRLRVHRVTYEAPLQGGALSQEDVACILGLSRKTVQRVFACFRRRGQPLGRGDDDVIAARPSVTPGIFPRTVNLKGVRIVLDRPYPVATPLEFTNQTLQQRSLATTRFANDRDARGPHPTFIHRHVIRASFRSGIRRYLYFG